MAETKNIALTEQEEKFCLMFVNGLAHYCGNAGKCYHAVFEKPNGKRKEDENSSFLGMKLAHKENVKERIDELNEFNAMTAGAIRPRVTSTLLKIMDECSTDVYEDQAGNPLSPAALRSVAVNAGKVLNDMYGIKEDIAHKIQIEGADGSGITFNVIVPEKKKNEDELDEIEE
jgi:hypothetical protein